MPDMSLLEVFSGGVAVGIVLKLTSDLIFFCVRSVYGFMTKIL